MRGLTVRQPWCQAIADGHKLIENRSAGFPKSYRGPLLIHSALGWADAARYDPRIRDLWGTDSDHAAACRYALRHVPAYRHRPPHPFTAGHVLAVAELVDVHPASGCCAPWGEDTYKPANPEQRPPGRVTHLVFEDVRRLAWPIEARGALGLWRPSSELVDAVRSQLR